MHIIGVKTRVEAAHTVNIAHKRAAVYTAGIAEIGLEAVASTQFIECCYGGNDLHCRRRTHQLALIMAVDYRVGIKVINHHSYLRSLEHVVLQQLVDGHLHVTGPCNRVIFQEQTVVIVPQCVRREGITVGKRLTKFGLCVQRQAGNGNENPGRKFYKKRNMMFVKLHETIVIS